MEDSYKVITMVATVSTALAALAMFPLLARKTTLESKKLKLENKKLELETSEKTIKQVEKTDQNSWFSLGKLVQFVFFSFSFISGVFFLYSEVHSEQPVTRAAVFYMIIWSGLTVFYAAFLLRLVIYAIYDFKYSSK